MISLAMIVKNEQKYLKDCLESVRGIADEIVIVDTGSTDNTVNIAAEYNARILNFEWINDFSAARNYALDNCSGDWILYLDADERLDFESRKEIKKITSVKNKHAYYCRLLNVDEFNNNSSVMNYVRLFPLDSKVRFSGAVHEQIEQSLLDNGYTLKQSTISISHIGYNVSLSEIKLKAERNLQILLKEYDLNHSGYTAFHLGQTYNVLENTDSAVKYFELALGDFSLAGTYKSNVCRYLAVHYADKNDLERAHKLISESLQYDSEQILSLLAASKIYLKCGLKNQAVEFVKRALELNNKFLRGIKTSIQNAISDEKTILCLGLEISVLSGSYSDQMFFRDRLSKMLKNSANSKELDFLLAVFDNKKSIETNLLALPLISEKYLDLFFVLLKRRDDKTKFLSYLERLAIQYSGNANMLTEYSLVLSELNYLDEAIEGFKKALSLSNNPAVIFYLVSAYLKSGRINEVTGLINESLESYKNNQAVLEKILMLKNKLQNYF